MSFREDKKMKKMRNLEFLIDELISTEEEYIKKMAFVVNGYLEEFRKKEDALVPVPEDLKDYKGLFVFANIEEIYLWHRDFFHEALVKHRHSPKDMGKAFLESESQFHMYAKYCNNKALSDFVVTEYAKYFDKVHKRLGHKLELADFLITPVQRLSKYELLLKQISEHIQELEGDWENMRAAHYMIKTVLKNINDFAELQGIKNYNGDISDHGQLIFSGFLWCKSKEKKKRRHVFLFKRLLIFTSKQDSKRKYGMPTYNYKLEIPMNKLHLKELPNKRFTLESTDPNLQTITLICHGEDDEMHAQWLEEIQKQLTIQANLITDLVNPTRCGEEDLLL